MGFEAENLGNICHPILGVYSGMMNEPVVDKKTTQVYPALSHNPHTTVLVTVVRTSAVKMVCPKQILL